MEKLGLLLDSTTLDAANTSFGAGCLRVRDVNSIAAWNELTNFVSDNLLSDNFKFSTNDFAAHELNFEMIDFKPTFNHYIHRLIATFSDEQRFQRLYIARIQRCHRDEAGDLFVDLVRQILKLPLMMKLHTGKPIAEINLRGNRLDDGLLKRMLKVEHGKPFTKILGVSKLVLSENDFTDSAFLCCGVVFTNIQELHLARNERVTSEFFNDAFCQPRTFNHLNVLNLDGSGLTSRGLQSITNAMKSLQGREFELCIRSIHGIEGEIAKLDHQCRSTKTNEKPVVKHDLLSMSGEATELCASQHSRIDIQLKFSGHDPLIYLSCNNCMATSRIQDVVQGVVLTLNEVCCVRINGDNAKKMYPAYAKVLKDELERGNAALLQHPHTRFECEFVELNNNNSLSDMVSYNAGTSFLEAPVGAREFVSSLKLKLFLTEVSDYSRFSDNFSPSRSRDQLQGTSRAKIPRQAK